MLFGFYLVNINTNFVDFFNTFIKQIADIVYVT